MSKEIDAKVKVQFTQTSTFDNITSGENISTSFGKISNWLNEIDEKIDTEATYDDMEALFGRFLTFQGTAPFTLGTKYGKHWDGTLEYSNDRKTWETWDGTTTLSSGEGNVLYLRGKNNTRFATGTSSGNFTNFVFTTNGTIACNGDIRTLLDYKNPENTTMANYCYYNMFYNCTHLTEAPELPATTLTNSCYGAMFLGCTHLTKSPELPATTLAYGCYWAMFLGCTSLTEAPKLPATALADGCYNQMFNGCTSLTKVPTVLPATTLTDSCYYCMFYNCTSLTKAPTLPATTLARLCYAHMFYGCTSLTAMPALPATTLAQNCYYNMFYGCTKIKISTTQTDEYQTSYRIPTSGTGTVGSNSMTDMFYGTGGTFTGTPEINTTYYTSNTVVPAS